MTCPTTDSGDHEDDSVPGFPPVATTGQKPEAIAHQSWELFFRNGPTLGLDALTARASQNQADRESL